MKYNRVLTIAGSDSGGGAGIQADIKAISAMGCFAMSAITAVTVQNTVGVRAVHPIPMDIIKGQIEAVLEDIGADAIKVGMVNSRSVAEMLVSELERFKVESIVFDPVMVATSGDPLIEEDAIEALKNILLPIARVITPNIPEAEILMGRKITSQEELPTFAKELADKFSTKRKVSVLLKAGHLTEDIVKDIFYNAEDETITELASRRIETPNTHGTGCTLSSALAAALANGLPLTDAARAAKEYISSAIESGAKYQIGKGHGAVNHFFSLKK